MSEGNTLVNTGPLAFLKSMRSPRGFWGVVVLLAAIPLALLYQRIFDAGISTFTHWVLVIGCGLIALAVFDFRKLPRWINWLGFLFVAVEGAIFFLQGLADLLQNDSLTYFAYQVLGQQLEAAMLWLFVLIWGGALLIRDSWGRTRIFGIVALVVFFAAELLRVSLNFLGAPPIDLLRVFLLLPFLWLLLESIKQPRLEGVQTP